jgi:O-antigen ligase
MNSDLLKLLVPVVFILMWLDFSRKNKSIHLAGAALFFTSIAAFSQNFVFIYRELHQTIQVLMILFAIRTVIKEKKINKVNFIFLAFLIFVFISLIFANNFDDDARVQLVNLLAAIGVTNYLYNSIYSISRLQIVMQFVGQLTVMLAIFGLIEFSLNISQRVEVTFANANYYAFFLGVGSCVAIKNMSNLRTKLSLTIIFIAIILSGSRAAFIFPILQIFWYVYRFKSFKHIIIYGVIGVFAIIGLAASGITRFSDIQAIEGSDAERIIFTRIAYEMANDHPFTGVGWGRYISEFESYSSTAEKIFTSTGVIDVSGQERRVTHNDLTRILAELGWIALVASLILLIFGFIKIFKNKKHQLGYVFPIWSGIIIFSLTHNNLNGALFWFLFLMPFYFFREHLKNHDDDVSLKDVERR